LTGLGLIHAAFGVSALALGLTVGAHWKTRKCEPRLIVLSSRP
jgi:hypothetical protein